MAEIINRVFILVLTAWSVFVLTRNHYNRY